MDFSQEELDRMYDEAMAWEPPLPPTAPAATDPRAVLQKVIQARERMVRPGERNAGTNP